MSPENPVIDRFSAVAADTAGSVSVVWVPGRPAETEVVVTAGARLASVRGESGAEVYLVSSSHPEPHAQRLLDLWERDPDRFVPPRETQGSFLLIDPRRGELVYGRDRTAVHHLYTAWHGDTLLLSTHIQPFVGTVCTELDPIGMQLYIFACTTPFMLYQGLFATLPGQWKRLGREATPDSVDLFWGETFWQIEEVEVPGDYDEATRRYADLLTECVEDNLHGSSAGLFLSGGSDSASVLGALMRLGVSQVVAVHATTDGQTLGDRELVERLDETFSFDLHWIRPDHWDQPWMPWMERCTEPHLNGSYETFPMFCIAADQLERHLPADSTVYNGEMCILDQGFNESGVPRRGLKRWLYKGAGRHLAKFGPVVPEAVRRLGGALGRQGSMAGAVLEGGIELLHSLGRPGHYYAGMKVGGQGLPGSPRANFRLGLQEDFDVSEVIVERFFRRWQGRLVGPLWKQTIGTFANAWYSEMNNFTMVMTALNQEKYGLCFPFSSVDLMDFAGSLPIEWTIDKQIQKDASHRHLGLPADVAFHLKDHRRVVMPRTNLLSPEDREQVMCQLESTDFGPLQRGVRERLELVRSGAKPFALYEMRLYCLAVYKRLLDEGVARTRALEQAGS